jgi:hypothetical protein
VIELWTATQLVAQFASMYVCLEAAESLQRIPELRCYLIA